MKERSRISSQVLNNLFRCYRRKLRANINQRKHVFICFTSMIVNLFYGRSKIFFLLIFTRGANISGGRCINYAFRDSSRRYAFIVTNLIEGEKLKTIHCVDTLGCPCYSVTIPLTTE